MKNKKHIAFLLIVLIILNNVMVLFAETIKWTTKTTQIKDTGHSIKTTTIITKFIQGEEEKDIDVMEYNSVKNGEQVGLNVDDIYENHQIESFYKFYKNFCIDINCVRFRFFNSKGEMIKQLFFAPTQFNNNASIIKIKKKNIYGETDRSKEFIMAGDREYTLYIKDGFIYDDNIPLYEAERTNDNSTNFMGIVYRYYKRNEVKQTFEEWIGTGEEKYKNLYKLLDDHNITIEGKTIEEWNKKEKEDEIANSIIIEPVIFYPTMRQEITCNKNEISRMFNLSFSALDTGLIKKVITGDGDAEKTFELLNSNLNFYYHSSVNTIGDRILKLVGLKDDIGVTQFRYKQYISLGEGLIDERLKQENMKVGEIFDNLLDGTVGELDRQLKESIDNTLDTLLPKDENKITNLTSDAAKKIADELYNKGKKYIASKLMWKTVTYWSRQILMFDAAGSIDITLSNIFDEVILPYYNSIQDKLVAEIFDNVVGKRITNNDATKELNKELKKKINEYIHTEIKIQCTNILKDLLKTEEAKQFSKELNDITTNQIRNYIETQSSGIMDVKEKRSFEEGLKRRLDKLEYDEKVGRYYIWEEFKVEIGSYIPLSYKDTMAYNKIINKMSMDSAKEFSAGEYIEKLFFNSSWVDEYTMGGDKQMLNLFNMAETAIVDAINENTSKDKKTYTIEEMKELYCKFYDQQCDNIIHSLNMPMVVGVNKEQSIERKKKETEEKKNKIKEMAKEDFIQFVLSNFYNSGTDGLASAFGTNISSQLLNGDKTTSTQTFYWDETLDSFALEKFVESEQNYGGIKTDENAYEAIVKESSEEIIIKVQNKLKEQDMLYKTSGNVDTNITLKGGKVNEKGNEIAGKVILNGGNLVVLPFKIATESEIEKKREEEDLYGGKPNEITLMEDELAYPFQLTTNKGGKFSGSLKVEISPYHWKHEWLGSHEVESANGNTRTVNHYGTCNKKTSGPFNYTVDDYSNYNTNFLISASQNYHWSYNGTLSEGATTSYNKIDHLFTGYRDKTKDLRTLYPLDALTKEEKEYEEQKGVEAAISAFGISGQNHIPNSKMIVEGNGSITSQHNANFSVNDYGSETNECTTKKSCGECGEWQCPGGHAKTINTSSEQSLLNKSNSFGFIQWYTLGKNGSGNLVNPTVQGSIENNVASWNWMNNFGYKNPLGTGNVISQYAKQGQEISFFPYIKMRYATQNKKEYTNVYITSENLSSIPRSVVVNVAKQQHSEPNIYLDNRWANWKEALKSARNQQIDYNSIAQGGSTMSLYTRNSVGSGSSKASQADPCSLGVQVYMVCVPDEMAKYMNTYDKTVSQAKEDIEKFGKETEENLGKYNIEKWGAEGIFLTEKDFKNNKHTVCVDNGGGDTKQENKFGGRTLDRTHEKYYLHYNAKAKDNESRINVKKYDEIKVFTIKSDVDGNVHLYTDGTEIGTFKGKGYKASTLKNINYDWWELNDINGFVDNFIKSLDFALDNGHTRLNRKEWYNEAINGISCVRGFFNYEIDVNENGIFEIIDPALAGEQKTVHDMYSSNGEIDKTWRTFRYQLSPTHKGGKTKRNAKGNIEGYLGTIDGMEVYCQNMEELLYSKLFYMSNTTVYNIQ